MNCSVAVVSMRMILFVVALTGASGLMLPPQAEAAGCSDSAEAIGDFIAVEAECSQEADVGMNPIGDSGSGPGGPDFTEYQWLSVCATPGQSSTISSEVECAAALTCPEPEQRLYRLWGRGASTGAWSPLSTQCFGETPEAPNVPRPQVTPALVLREIQRIGLPTLQAMTQPEGKTLVNFDTIFYTQAQRFTATVTLLGRQVDIVAEPTSYTWHHGDGRTTATSTPGAPYPSREITYRYSDAQTTVRPRVDVTYSARFRVNGGAWQDIDETVTITGPEGSLRVSEARGSLSGNYG
jgi:hypothetical protein